MKQSKPARRGCGDFATSARLLANPLDFIGEDYLRERRICAVIEGLAMDASLDRQEAMTVLRFLNEEMNVHLRDEVEDLFPLLSRRCTVEDSIDSAISRIKADQNEAMRLLPEMRATLAGCLDTGADLTVEGRALLMRFTGYVRRHLMAEIAILLPIARARLTRADLRMLSQHMRSRRGLSPVQETPHAE